MSFTGTQDKCKTCDKTVHFIDLLTADGVSYHKTCFKCSHCKGTLSVRVHGPIKLRPTFCIGKESFLFFFPFFYLI